jgi:hypothetical protein
VLKKTSKTGRWFKAHGWVTREYFEKLVRAGKLPLGQEGLVKGEAPVPATGSLYTSAHEQQKYSRMLDVLEGARYLPGSLPLMMMLANQAVYLHERLQEYQQIKSLMDVPLWVEYRYTQQFLNTVDQIFKMTSSVARAKGMTEVTISAIVKVINDVITDAETKTRLVAGLQKIAQAEAKKREKGED